MKKKIVTKTKQGSWLVFWIWAIICFPVAMLYWLFKIRKVKTYSYEEKGETK